MSTLLRQTLAVITIAFSAAPSFANNTPATAATLPTVVVTASKLPSSAQTTPATITVLAPSPIIGDNIGDVISRAGINAFSLGANKQQTSSFIRGANYNHTLLLQDGIRLNSSIDGAPNFSSVMLGQNDHVEVLEGPSSVQYGVNAIGGVVNVVSNAPTKSGARLKLAQGSTQFAAGQLDASLVKGNAYADLNVLNQAQDGSEIVSGSNVTNAYKALQGKLTVGGTIGERVETSLQYRNSDDQGQYVGFGSPVQRTYDQRNTVIAHNLKADLGAWQYHSKLADVRLKRNEQQGSSFTYSTSQQVDQRLLFTPDVGNNTFMLGLDGAREKGENSSYRENNNVFGVYGQHTLENDVVRTQVGARYEYSQLWGDTWAGQVSGGAKFNLAKQTHFAYVNLGRAFKAPTLIDRYGSSGNPALTPEIGLSAELGDKTTVLFDSQHVSSLQSKYYVYQQQVSDLITYFPLTQSTGISKNIDKVYLRGLGVQQTLTFSQGAELSGRYELLYAKDATTNAELLRRPRHTAAADLKLPIGSNVDLAFDAQYRHAARDFAVDCDRRAVMGLALNYALNPQVNISLQGKNLFDAKANVAEFSSPQFYLAAPRWLGVSMQVKTR